MNTLIEKITEAFLKIFSAPVKMMLEPVFGESQLESIVKFLKLAGGKQSGDFQTEQFFKMINTVFDLLKPIGFALITTFFIIHMIDVISKDALTLDAFIKSLIALIIVISLAANSGEIMSAIFNIGEVSITTIFDGITSGKQGGNGVTSENISDAAEMLTANYGLGALVMAILLWLFHQIVVIGIDVAAFSRIIDIGWRAACMPIGIANSFEGGTNSSGMRYMKSFFAAVFSGALMLIICAVGFSLATSLLSTQLSFFDNITNKGFWTLLVEVIAVQLATMGAAISAPAKAKELFS